MKHLTDTQLLEHARDLNKREAALDLDWIDTLREIYARKLYLAYGSENFHVFCTRVLHMSDDSAWRRMKAAALADRFPDVVKPLIAAGKVHLTGLALLNRIITPDNGERLIQEAAGKTTTEIKAIIAREAPEICTSGVRQLPSKQLSETTWRFQAAMDADTKALLAEVQDLANDNDCDHILHEALAAYRDVLKVKKQKALKRQPAPIAESARTPPAASMRQPHDPHDPYIPRWMEREVWQRDGHRCTFVGYGGRCTARRDLQVHHIVPVALGGLTLHGNLTLHCGEHNRFQAVLDLGPAMANAWRKRGAAAVGR